MRRKLIVGNWKMHGSKSAITELLTQLRQILPPLQRTDVAVCPPFVYLDWAQQYLAGSPMALGAQDVCAEAPGAHTGEIAAAMLRECNCSYVIVGHSERREQYGESSGLVARKTVAALQRGLTPIVCVGESLAERDAGTTLDCVQTQLDAVLDSLDHNDAARLVLAYEPIWAIGTGRTATPAQARAVHKFLRQRLGAAAATVRILYGGSVKADNAAEIFAQPDIDGGLVGGASLNAEEFAAICNAAE
jgi:triosephosphate isomerase